VEWWGLLRSVVQGEFVGLRPGVANCWLMCLSVTLDLVSGVGRRVSLTVVVCGRQVSIGYRCVPSSSPRHRGSFVVSARGVSIRDRLKHLTPRIAGPALVGEHLGHCVP